MNTIRNYLESMFARLPDTQEVIRAKCELGQMMEDKYSELMQEGKSENEAIAQVIAEFGNLDELGDTLGISHLLKQDHAESKDREVSMEEIQSCLDDCAHDSLLHGLGSMFAIISPSGIILTQAFGWTSGMGIAAGILFLFAMLAACIGLHVYAGLQMKKWDFLKPETCSIDYGTVSMVDEQHRNSHDALMLQRTVAIVLYCICYIPLSLLAVASGKGSDLAIGVVILLLMVGAATCLITVSTSREKGYRRILSLNDKQRMEGRYSKSRETSSPVKYTNQTIAAVMTVFWPTVVCIYLIVSFLTFSWGISWLIFPVAVVAENLIKAVFGEKEGNEK